MQSLGKLCYSHRCAGPGRPRLCVTAHGLRQSAPPARLYPCFFADLSTPPGIARPRVLPRTRGRGSPQSSLLVGISLPPLGLWTSRWHPTRHAISCRLSGAFVARDAAPEAGGWCRPQWLSSPVPRLPRVQCPCLATALLLCSAVPVSPTVFFTAFALFSCHCSFFRALRQYNSLLPLPFLFTACLVTACTLRCPMFLPTHGNGL